MIPDCATAREMLSARLDGELSSVDVGRLDAHLDGCEDCRTFAAQAERLQTRLRLSPAPAVPDLSEVILDRVDAPAPARLHPRRWLAAAAAAIVILAGVAVVTTRAVQTPPAAPDVAVGEVYLGEADAIGAVYVTMVNSGGPDRLVGARSASAQRVTLHRTEERGGVLVMQSVSSVPVGGQSTVVLAPLGGHLMLEDLTAPVAAGETLTLILEFDRSGEIEVVADVLSWSEIVDRNNALTVDPSA